MVRILFLLTMLLSAAHGVAQSQFPPGAWETGEGAWKPGEEDAFYENWFGRQLRAMEEAPLWPEAATGTARPTLRLLFLPTFDNGTMVRVYRDDDDTMRFVFKRLSGAGGYEPGSLIRTVRGRLGQDDRNKLVGLVRQVAPFGARTLAKVETADNICFDGTSVVLEVVEGRDYAAISRHECELVDGDPIHQLVVFLNALSGNRLVAPDTFEPPRP